VVPGHTDKVQSRTWIDGHVLAVPKYAKHPGWSLEFAQRSPLFGVIRYFSPVACLP